jgi:hypothetical protein
MNITKKTAHELLDELFKAEPKLNKWRRHGIGIVMSKETFKTLKESDHPNKDFILQGVLVERRGNLRF